MTDWPAIPDLPGHVVEVSRREDGARRRLDLFVHPEGLQPHHVAIRLDLWEGRAPELHAGFGAEARPVCLPEHLDPQEAAVEAAAGLVARMVGEGPAARLWDLWAAARGRLEERIRLFDRENLARHLFFRKRTIRRPSEPVLFVPSTRDNNGHEAVVVVNDGQSQSNTLVDPTVYRTHCVPMTPQGLADAEGLTGHQILQIISDRDRIASRLYQGFRDFEGGTYYVIPSTVKGWTAWGGAPFAKNGRRSGTDNSFVAIGGGWFIRMTRRENGTFDELRQAIAIDANFGGVAGITADVGQRDQDSTLKPAEVKCRGRRQGWGKEALLRDGLHQIISFLVAIDPDCALTSHSLCGSPSFESLSDHPVVQGLEIPPSLKSIVADLLGTSYQRALAEAKALDRHKEPTP